MSAFGHQPFEPRAGRSLVDSLTLWGDRVLEWNQRMDLTAARSADELVDLLLADAAAVASLRECPPAQSWVDVGTGAGGPGVALALLEPQIRLLLVEPKTKRVAFLRSVLGELGRTDVSVQRCRSEQLAPSAHEIAISRATFAPAEWLEQAAKLARRGAWVLLAQGEPPVHPAWQLVTDHRYTWPLTGAERRALYYTRSEANPAG